jgi:hypothetical protein
MKTMLSTILAAALLCFTTFAFSQDVVHDVDKAAKDTAHATDKAAKDTGHATKVAAKDTAKGTENRRRDQDRGNEDRTRHQDGRQGYRQRGCESRRQNRRRCEIRNYTEARNRRVRRGRRDPANAGFPYAASVASAFLI